jgi:hypothetical protein
VSTRTKGTSEKWKTMQTRPKSAGEYDELKKTEAFIRGAVVVAGKVWRGDYVGYYLNDIDLDNGKAIEEIRNASNLDRNAATLDDLAQSTGTDLTKVSRGVGVKIHLAKVLKSTCPRNESGKIPIDASAHLSQCPFRKRLVIRRYTVDTQVPSEKFLDDYGLGVAL